MIDRKLKENMEDKSLYAEAMNELYKEFPFKREAHEDEDNDKNKLSYSNLLSLEEECSNFGRQASNDGVFMRNPKTLEWISNCPDKLLETVIRRNINKHTFFD